MDGDEGVDRRKKTIFITGATGAIGRSVLAHLLQSTEHNIVCLVRQPSRLRLPFSLRAAARSRLRLIVGSLQDVHLYAQVAKEADSAMLLHCSWGGADCHAVNVQGTVDVIDHLNPSADIIYFSSASLLHPEGGVKVSEKDAAARPSRSYTKSKASALAALLDRPELQKRLSVLYPVVVLGTRRTPLAASIQESLLPSLLSLTGLAPAVHFIHARDAASVACFLLERPKLGRRDSSVEHQKAVSGVDGVTKVFTPLSKSRQPEWAARHLVLAQSAATTAWVRGLGGTFGALLGLALGVAGAPADVTLAGLSAMVWCSTGIGGGIVAAQTLPSALVSSLLALSCDHQRWAGVPGGVFESSVHPGAIGVKAYAQTLGAVSARHAA